MAWSLKAKKWQDQRKITGGLVLELVNKLKRRGERLTDGAETNWEIVRCLMAWGDHLWARRWPQTWGGKEKECTLKKIRPHRVCWLSRGEGIYRLLTDLFLVTRVYTRGLISGFVHFSPFAPAQWNRCWGLVSLQLQMLSRFLLTWRGRIFC